MDVYTTSFTYPRRSRSLLPSAPPLDFQPQQPPADSYGISQQLQQTPATTDPARAAADEAIQKLALMVMSMHGCHVSFQPVDQGKSWNFLITGAYQQVMFSRGLILKECPVQASLFPATLVSLYLTPRNPATSNYQGDTV
jgi:hypothetical protein